MTNREQNIFNEAVAKAIVSTIHLIVAICIGIGLVTHVSVIADLWASSFAVRLGVYILGGVYTLSILFIWAIIIIASLYNRIN